MLYWPTETTAKNKTMLQLGSLQFPSNLIQGPLAGYSCAPFRRLATQYGQPAFCCTEMISAKTLIHHPKLSRKRYVWKDPEEGKLCYQISSADPTDLGLAVRMLTDDGADLIDLNCGCPVNKVRGKGAGSQLLAQPSLLGQLIEAMKANTHVPVSVKIRVDGNSNESFNPSLARVIEDAGADFVMVHGRHWTESYDTPCRLDEIRYFTEQLSIPVIGNGDVKCVDSLKAMLATGCAGVMIARAGVGQPWLFEQLRCELQGQAFTPPDNQTVIDLFLQHVEQLAELLCYEKMAVLQARKFAKYYFRFLPRKHAFFDAMNRCESLENLRKLLETLKNTHVPKHP
jgi:tRNA-dihydrouridine synthase B